MSEIIGYATMDKNGSERLFLGSEKPKTLEGYTWGRQLDNGEIDYGTPIPRGTLNNLVPKPKGTLWPTFHWHYSKSIIELRSTGSH